MKRYAFSIVIVLMTASYAAAQTAESPGQGDTNQAAPRAQSAVPTPAPPPRDSNDTARPVRQRLRDPSRCRVGSQPGWQGDRSGRPGRGVGRFGGVNDGQNCWRMDRWGASREQSGPGRGAGLRAAAPRSYRDGAPNGGRGQWCPQRPWCDPDCPYADWDKSGGRPRGGWR